MISGDAPQRQNINFLSHDLEEKRRIVKKAIAEAELEYTDPRKEPNIKKKESPAKGPGFFGRMISNFGSLFKSKKINSEKIEDKESKKQATEKKNESINLVKPIKLPSFLQETLRATPNSGKTTQSADKSLDDQVAPLPPQSPPQKRDLSIIKKGKKIEMTNVSKQEFASFGINLLSGEFAESAQPVDRKGFFIWSLIVTVLLIGVIYLSIHLFQTNKARKANALLQINSELKTRIKSYDGLVAEDQLIGKRVAGISALLSNRISWPVFLRNLESATIPEITYLTMAASEQGKIVLSIIATSYTSLGRQLTVFEKDTPWVNEVSINSASLLEDPNTGIARVASSFLLDISPKAFEKE